MAAGFLGLDALGLYAGTVPDFCFIFFGKLKREREKGERNVNSALIDSTSLASGR